MAPIMIGDVVDTSNGNLSNIVTINRTVSCDFYRDLAVISISNSNMDSVNNIDNNQITNNLCNHQIINISNASIVEHDDRNGYKWKCREFKVVKNELEYNNYYLIFNEESVNSNSYWILDNINEISNNENEISSEKFI